jgi:hypothetical protein
MDIEAALRLCNPSAPLYQSIAAAKELMKTEPRADMELAMLLFPRAPTNTAAGVKVAVRALEILDAISVGNRLVITVSHLTGHSDPMLRSKAVAFIGRRVRDLGWAKAHLSESDPRVQANLIESLWGQVSDECAEVLLQFSKSANNRVAGNAAHGLYLIGHEKAVDCIRSMTENPQSAFRITAAWLIGKSADPGLTDLLRPLLRDPDPEVRRASCKALVALGLKVQQKRQSNGAQPVQKALSATASS